MGALHVMPVSLARPMLSNAQAILAALFQVIRGPRKKVCAIEGTQMVSDSGIDLPRICLFLTSYRRYAVAITQLIQKDLVLCAGGTSRAPLTNLDSGGLVVTIIHYG